MNPTVALPPTVPPSVDVLSRALEHLPEGVLVRATQTHAVVYANAVMRDLAQGMVEVGDSVERLLVMVHQEDAPAVARQMAEHSAGGMNHDCRLRQQDGSHRWVNVRSFALSSAPTQRLTEQGLTEQKIKEQVLAEYVAVFVMDIHERKLSEASFAHAHQHDGLTGLYNRQAFGLQVERLLHTAHAKQQNVLLAVLDLDGLGPVNDALGRGWGDALLQQVGKRLGVLYKESAQCCVGRLGGDEFGIAFTTPNNIHATEATATRVLGNMKAPFFIEGKPLRIAAHLGMAEYPQHAHTVDALLKCADVALLDARRMGRSGHQTYHPALHEHVHERNSLDVSLQQAIHNQEFELHYQPKVDCATGRCVGAEALLRWNRPSVGMVFPGQFIAALEHSGLIVPLGDWVIHEACRQMTQWREMGYEIPVAINVSAQQLNSTPPASAHHPDMGLLATIAHALKMYPDALLELELTESTLMANAEHAVAVLNTLQHSGIRWSIDDFGTGYSSLSYLKRFPVSTLKIDRSFVTDLHNTPHDRAIVQAIIAMAHSLDMCVVAEGVETQEQHDVLQDLGCDELQGFLIARPMSAAHFEHWLQTNSD